MPHNVFNLYHSLINGNGLQDEYDGFEGESEINEREVEGKKVMTMFYLSPDYKMLDYSGYLQLRSKYYAAKLSQDIEELFEATPKDQFSQLAPKIQFDIDKLIRQFTSWKILEKRRFFYEDFLIAKDDIDRLIEFYAKVKDGKWPTGAIQSKSETMGKATQEKDSYPKIQWMGKTNVLVTLFYDLMNGQDSREPMIKATKADIKEFLMNNFIDADGNTLSESTITTIFTPSKDEKRANKGDRVELGNLRRK
jgi:hypothetical protein